MIIALSAKGRPKMSASASTLVAQAGKVAASLQCVVWHVIQHVEWKEAAPEVPVFVGQVRLAAIREVKSIGELKSKISSRKCRWVGQQLLDLGSDERSTVES